MKCLLAKRNAGLTYNSLKVIHCTGYLKLRVDRDLATGAVMVHNMGLVAMATALPPSPRTEVMLHKNMFMFRAELDLKLVLSDATVTSLTGYAPQDLVENTLYQYVHPLDIFQLQQTHKLCKYFFFLMKNTNLFHFSYFQYFANNKLLRNTTAFLLKKEDMYGFSPT